MQELNVDHDFGGRLEFFQIFVKSGEELTSLSSSSVFIKLDKNNEVIVKIIILSKNSRRVNKNGGTCLDHMFEKIISKINNISTIIYQNIFTDHYTTVLIINLKIKKVCDNSVKLNVLNYDKLYKITKKIDWKVFDGMNDINDLFTDNLQRAINRATKKKKKLKKETT